MNSSFQRSDDAILIFKDFDGLQEGFAHFFRVILALHSRSLFLPRFFLPFCLLSPLAFTSLADVMCKQLIKFSWMSLTLATRIMPDCLWKYSSFRKSQRLNGHVRWSRLNQDTKYTDGTLKVFSVKGFSICSAFAKVQLYFRMKHHLNRCFRGVFLEF